MDDFEDLNYEDIKNLVEELYEDNCYSIFCAGAKIFKYKNQFVKISVAKEEDDL